MEILTVILVGLATALFFVLSGRTKKRNHAAEEAARRAVERRMKERGEE